MAGIKTSGWHTGSTQRVGVIPFSLEESHMLGIKVVTILHRHLMLLQTHTLLDGAAETWRGE